MINIKIIVYEITDLNFDFLFVSEQNVLQNFRPIVRKSFITGVYGQFGAQNISIVNETGSNQNKFN